MSTLTYAEAKRNLAAVLDEALKKGEVRIRRKDGRVFVVKPDRRKVSPLDVEGVDLGISTPEILEFIHEGRRKKSR